MKWKKYTLETTTDAVDMISATLAELGIEGVEVQDNVPLTESETKGMFIDILPELPPDDGTARVSFYLDPEDAVEEKLSEVRASLEELRQFMDPDRYNLRRNRLQTGFTNRFQPVIIRSFSHAVRFAPFRNGLTCRTCITLTNHFCPFLQPVLSRN